MAKLETSTLNCPKCNGKAALIMIEGKVNVSAVYDVVQNKYIELQLHQGIEVNGYNRTKCLTCDFEAEYCDFELRN